MNLQSGVVAVNCKGLSSSTLSSLVMQFDLDFFNQMAANLTAEFYVHLKVHLQLEYNYNCSDLHHSLYKLVIFFWL